jgi:hypothetical protein
MYHNFFEPWRPAGYDLRTPSLMATLRNLLELSPAGCDLRVTLRTLLLHLLCMNRVPVRTSTNSGCLLLNSCVPSLLPNEQQQP